jgi:hypothetical protein
VFAKSLLLVLPVGLLAALSLAPVAGSARAARTSHRVASATSFSDAAGDSGAAADVTDVDVGNDLVAGHLVFWITVANRPDDLVGDDELDVFIDSDNNPATGDFGSEYLIWVDAESVGLSRWDGTSYVSIDVASLPASLSARYFKGDKAVRVAIHPRDLGITSAFNFAIGTYSGEAYDAAPNGPPDWAYAIASGKLQLAVSGAAVVPKRPTAGKALALAMEIVRTDLNEVLDQGKVSCTLKAGTKSVRATRARFVSGLALCAWNLPKSAKGKTVRGTISVTFGGTTVTRTFSARAR